MTLAQQQQQQRLEQREAFVRLSSSSRNNKTNTNINNKQYQQDEEKYSFKSCGRDSGHGGSEQEDSPHAGTAAGKLTSLRLNNNVAPNHHQAPDRLVNSFAQHQELPSPEALLPDYRMAGESVRLPPQHRLRNQSPFNHTYTEISEGGKSITSRIQADPVYEEIEREGRIAAELQVSDLSDEDGRRMSSDVSRQSSRSYGDHRPLLPYTLPDHLHASTQHLPPSHHHLHHIQQQLHHHQIMQNHMQQIHMQQQHQLQQQQIQQQLQQQQQQQQAHQLHPLHHHHHLPPSSSQQILETNHHISPYGSRARPEALNLTENGGGGPLTQRNPQQLQCVASEEMASVVQPLSEPNLRSWEAVQHHRDMQHLQQHLGEMTVAVLSGEQVVCKLKSPLAPIQETSTQGAPAQSPSSATPPGTSTTVTEQFKPSQPPTVSSIPTDHPQEHKHPISSLTYSHC